jgi:predicted short-subunit dehydrogenase-like oxidoreductase (DUF2520 family)
MWTIIGRGRLGRTLAQLLPGTGREVETVGRGERVDERSDVVLLCVPDGEIAGVAASLPVGPVVLHCSGACDVDVLAPHVRAGSWHPLMTFPGPEVAVPEMAGTPVGLAGHPEAVEVGRELARALGMEPFEVPGDRRLYHAAAVMAGNFATVLLAEAADVLAAAGVERERAASLLIPLALRSIHNGRFPLAQALTGPIARGDEATLSLHRAALQEHKMTDTLQLYDTFVKRAHRRLATPTGTGG